MPRHPRWQPAPCSNDIPSAGATDPARAAQHDAAATRLFLGYRVEQPPADAPEAYRLISPCGAVYRLMRITTAPDLLYVVDRTGRISDLAGGVTFTDRTGVLHMVD